MDGYFTQFWVSLPVIGSVIFAFRCAKHASTNGTVRIGTDLASQTEGIQTEGFYFSTLTRESECWQ